MSRARAALALALPLLANQLLLGLTMSCVDIHQWLLALIIILLMLYSMVDLAYFVRMTYTVLVARYIKKRTCVLEMTTYRSWCFLNDIDTLIYHMNNARYLRELDFARADFYERTGLYRDIRRAGGAVVQGATTIRYRRYIRPVTCYNICSKIVFWDEGSVFMEHMFVGSGGFVHAVAICRQRVLHASAHALLAALAKQCQDNCPPIPLHMPPELALWVQSNGISSERLRSAGGARGGKGGASAHPDYFMPPTCTCVAPDGQADMKKPS